MSSATALTRGGGGALAEGQPVTCTFNGISRTKKDRVEGEGGEGGGGGEGEELMCSIYQILNLLG